MRIVAINRTRRRVPVSAIRRDLRLTLAHLGRPGRTLDIVTVVCISAMESERLNRRFRRSRRPANVLSFRYNGEGEVLLAPSLIAREARVRGESYPARLRRLAVHGLLHLAGHHHEAGRRQAERFERKEERVLKSLGLA